MIELRAPCALLGIRLTEDRIETDVVKKTGVLLGRSWNLFLIKSRHGSSLGPSASGGGSALVSRGFRLLRSGAPYELRGSWCCAPSALSWCLPFSLKSMSSRVRRLAEAGLGLIAGYAFSAPYEDLKIRAK